MYPTIESGAKIMVDTADKTPSPPGIFVLWDGLALVCKRVSATRRSDPVELRVTSDNPAYRDTDYTASPEEAGIRARVIGTWRPL